MKRSNEVDGRVVEVLRPKEILALMESPYHAVVVSSRTVGGMTVVGNRFHLPLERTYFSKIWLAVWFPKMSNLKRLR
jgi:hypothetical protein